MAISLLYYARARRPINAQEAARHAPVGAEHRDLSCFYVAVCVGPIGLEGDVRVVDEDGHAAAMAITVATRRAVVAWEGDLHSGLELRLGDDDDDGP